MPIRGTLDLTLISAKTTTRRLNSMGLVACSSRAQRLSVSSRPSRLNSGTHKNLQRLVIAQSIQLSNIVLVKPAFSRRFSAIRQNPPSYRRLTHPASAGMGLTRSRVVQTPERLQPNVRSQFLIDAQHQADPFKLSVEHPDRYRARSWRSAPDAGESWSRWQPRHPR
jgi:hypothetical protein